MLGQTFKIFQYANKNNSKFMTIFYSVVSILIGRNPRPSSMH